MKSANNESLKVVQQLRAMSSENQSDNVVRQVQERSPWDNESSSWDNESSSWEYEGEEELSYNSLGRRERGREGCVKEGRMGGVKEGRMGCVKEGRMGGKMVGRVKWLENLCIHLNMDYSTEILRSLSLLTMISKVLRYKISKKDLREIYTVSNGLDEIDIESITNDMVESMLRYDGEMTVEYVIGICHIRESLKLVRYMMRVFKLDISINVSHRIGRATEVGMGTDDLSIILCGCESMQHRLLSIIRLGKKQKPNKGISQKKLLITKTILKDMGVCNTSLNKVKQGLVTVVSEEASLTERRLYELISEIKSFRIKDYTLEESVERKEPILKSVRTNYDGTSCVLTSLPASCYQKGPILKMKSKHFELPPSEFLQLVSIGLERIMPDKLKLITKHKYIVGNNKSFGEAVVTGNVERLYASVDILHGETSVSVDTNDAKLLILLTGRPEITPKLLYTQGVLSKDEYSIAEAKQYGCVILYQSLLEEKISELADARRFKDISDGMDIRHMYPFTTIRCYREACRSYGSKILVDVGRSRDYLCNTCHIAEMCTLCSSNSHSGPCHADEDTQTEGMLHKCPSCKIGLEKIDGCNHITCKCRTQFCWLCDTIFTQDPYPNTQPTNVTISMRAHYGAGRCNQFNHDD